VIVPPDPDHLARQDRRQQADVGQRPAPPGETGVTERVVRDLASRLFLGRPVDRDERDAIRMGNTSETHWTSSGVDGDRTRVAIRYPHEPIAPTPRPDAADG